MIRIIAVLCMLALLPLGAASADPLPLREAEAVADLFAANPRNVKDIGDPFVLMEDGTYYMFATGGPIGFNVWKSADLVAFEKLKALKKVDWASGDYWAPEVFRVGERYVMLFTARQRETGSLRTGIAFADAPEGPYEDPLGHPLMDFGFATIDATLIWDDAGNPYLIFVRDCSENMVAGHPESHIYGIPLASDLLSVVGEPTLLLSPDGEWELCSGDTRWNEGPAVLRRDGKYYLYFSVNGYFMKEYSVSVAVAEAPLGPYEKQENNPLLYYMEDEQGVSVSGPGHNAFFTVGEELFTSYHTHTYPQAPSGNRQLCVDRAGFHADGSAYINGPTLSSQLKPLADLGRKNWIPAAVSPEDPEAFLSDGDTCQREGSAPWVWHGASVTFSWPEEVVADLLMIYPAMEGAIAGRVTVNDALTADFTLEAGGKPGGAVILPFEEMRVTSLRVDFADTAAVGEILFLGMEK